MGWGVVNVFERGQVEKLPKGWKWIEIEKSPLEIIDGDRGKNYPKQNNFSKSGYCLFLNTGNVTSSGFDFSSCSFISQEVDAILRTGKLQFNDVVLTTRGTIGNTAWLDETIPYSILRINSGMVILRADAKKLFPGFLCQFIRSPQFREQIQSLQSGSAQPQLPIRDLKRIRLPLPPLPEQKQIVGILSDRLSTIDKARAATEAQLKAAKALPAAYLRQVFDSPEAQKWEQKKLGDIAETCSGSTPFRERKDYYVGTIPWVKTGELRDSIIHDTEEHISELALRETSVKLLPAKTLLIAMYGQGQTRGRTGLLAQPATTNQACFAILPDDQKFEPKYLQLWFRHSYSRLREETEGRGGNQPNLNGGLLREQIVCLPSVDEQRNVVSNLEQADKQIQRLVQSLQSQLNTINKLPAALLWQAFNGEL